jgi:NAD(P)-dependent dehydrogenase (short-subunit alcohol dehydrogenase family)
MARLSNKTAVITGGTTGIGFETAKKFVEEGARVIITGQNEERLKTAAQKLGENVIPVRVDVRLLSDLDALADRVKVEFGSLDILFANAGIGLFAPLNDVDEASYDTQFDINVKGLFFTVQKLAPLLEAGASIILNASSVHEKGMMAASIYCSTKASVRSFARNLAAELGNRKIRVNSLSPGIVLTDFQGKTGMSPEEINIFANSITQVVPLERAGQTEEIASAVVFLASDDSSYMTAADLVVDGGYMNV